MPERRRIGYRVVGTITDIKGNCGWGHKVGDQFDVSGHDNAGVCGFFYHDIFPDILNLQFGATRPWGDPDIIEVECRDRTNVVKMQLRRAKE